MTQVYAYCSSLYARPGETLEVMATAAQGETLIVDLVRPAPASSGNSFSCGFDPVATFNEKTISGTLQKTAPGSFASVDDIEIPHGSSGMTLTAFVWLAATAAREQTVMQVFRSGVDLCMLVCPTGEVAASVEVGARKVRLTTDAALPLRRWVFISLSIDAAGLAELRFVPIKAPGLAASAVVSVISRELAPFELNGDGKRWRATFAAARDTDGEPEAQSHLDGKMSSPMLFDRVLDDERFLHSSRRPSEDCPGVVAAWQLSHNEGEALIRDRTSGGKHGTVLNGPTVAVTGPSWDGTHSSFAAAPDQYDAIHFHSDDIDNAAWVPVCEVTLPDDLSSDIYAVRVRSATSEDHVPVVVQAGVDTPRPKVAFLVPTFTYLAYANSRLFESTDFAAAGISSDPSKRTVRDAQLARNREFGKSLYDKHADGSGVAYASFLRPLLTMRFDYVNATQDGPRHLSIDMFVPAWLRHLGIEFDVISDHALDAEGRAVLDGYDVVLTGSHPEYHSETMLDALQDHVDSGHHLMYLGGNGFYWVTGRSSHRPHVIEVRRGHAATRTWTGLPGEDQLSVSGTVGGLWRHRGRAPNVLAGVGMTAQGWDQASGFIRTLESRDESHAFIFEGVEEEIIGASGLALSGASGDELDRADVDLGTPVETVVVARSTPHSAVYQVALEELSLTIPDTGGDRNNLVRSDMVFMQNKAGGSVFSVGSITWLGSLAFADFQNSVSRVSENVLRRFTNGE